MKHIALITVLTAMLASFTTADEGSVPIPVGGKDLAAYQAKPLSNPIGGEAFKGSDFIHPLKTPSGFTVTDCNPESDHHHHFGLWWPWKYLVVENNRKVLCWELQKGDGIIEAKRFNRKDNGFTAKSVYIDRKAPDGPRTLINETVNVKFSDIMSDPATGYFLDIEIIHQIAIAKPIEVLKYRYSGFAFRGTHLWNRDTSTIITSEGKDRDTANFTNARWVRVEGETGKNKSAGVVLMSRPDNHAHPEKLRTWDKQHNGIVFINFNPVQDKSWTFEPGKTYTRNYRLFVYDGTLTVMQVEKMWKQYKKEIL